MSYRSGRFAMRTAIVKNTKTILGRQTDHRLWWLTTTFVTIAIGSGMLVGTQSSAAPKSKKTDKIVVAWENAPRTFDPRYSVDADSQYLEDLLHCSLIKFNPTGQITPDLAKSWQWSTPTSLSLDLRKNVKFSDGSGVTAQDVAATYGFFNRQDLKKPSPRSGAFAGIEDIKVDSSHRLTFKLKEPNAAFLSDLVVGVLPEKLVKTDLVEGPKNSVGCGPFVLTAAGLNSLVLKPNPNYSLGPKAKASELEIKVVKDEMTRFAKLRNGEVDIVQNGVSRDKLAEVKSKYPDLKVIERPGLNTAYLGFNMRDPILSKTPVRQAIALAIDRQSIIKYVLKDLATPATTLITPDDTYFDKTVAASSFDKVKARTLLDKAGFKDPDGPKGSEPRFTLTYKTTTNVTRVTIAKAIASQLAKVGIEVNVQPLEWGRFKADVEAGKVQLWSLKWVGFKDPDMYRYAFATESFPPGGGNRGWYSNTELDALLAQARQETDEQKRKDLYAKVQKLIAKELPYVFLWHERNFAVLRQDITDYEVYADGRYSALSKVTRR